MIAIEYDFWVGRRVIFVKCRIEGELGAIMGIYDRSYFQDIFPEEWPKEYLGELEKKRNQKREMC
ncbi:MAG: hypothetical protein WBA22_17790 [Candidatus Methanofastidiosia archaeon]